MKIFILGFCQPGSSAAKIMLTVFKCLCHERLQGKIGHCMLTLFQRDYASANSLFATASLA